jgi:hypothetical protein
MLRWRPSKWLFSPSATVCSPVKSLRSTLQPRNLVLFPSCSHLLDYQDQNLTRLSFNHHESERFVWIPVEFRSKFWGLILELMSRDLDGNFPQNSEFFMIVPGLRHESAWIRFAISEHHRSHVNRATVTNRSYFEVDQIRRFHWFTDWRN